MDARRRKAFARRLEAKLSELTELLAKTESASRLLGGKSPGDQGEAAAASYNRDVLFSQSDSGRSLLVLVQDALVRLEDGEFGICEECGRSINLKRLDAVPWTRYCRDCQEAVERNARASGAR